MKIFLVSLFVLVGFNACASHPDSGYYERINKASEKSFDGLDKELRNQN